MNYYLNYHLLLVLLMATDVSVQTAYAVPQSDTCKACNCQFNNVQVLEQLVEEKVNRAISNLALPSTVIVDQ